MENIEKRLEQLDDRLRLARRRAAFVWLAGIFLAAASILNVWLPAASAQGEQRGLEQRVASLEGQISDLRSQLSSQAEEVASLRSLLSHFSREGNEIFISGANLHIRNDLGTTDSSNGLGNLIVGYNELRPTVNDRSGSHNIVVGKGHNFNSFGGFAAGQTNDIAAPYASVSGGVGNRAIGPWSSVCGGNSNSAEGFYASVGGGIAISQNAAGGWSAGSQGINPVVGNFRSP